MDAARLDSVLALLLWGSAMRVVALFLLAWSV